MYYKSDNQNCFIDKNATIDTDKDGSATNDKDLKCNHVYKLTYTSPEVILMIHDGNEKKKIGDN